MHTGSTKKWGYGVLAGLLFSGLAIAATSPLLIYLGIDGTGLLTVQTNQLPKGWFSSRNTFDRAKSNIQTVYSLGATTCSAEKPGGTLNSTTDGGFTTENNPQGGVIGYYYSVSKDLSASQNHWYNHQHCDGSIEVHGCPQAVPVTVTSTAYDKNGACYTYTDDAGVTRCASDTKAANLGAVQDPDVVDTQCEEPASCGIGACVSSCEHAAKARYDAAVASCPLGKNGKPEAECENAARARELAEKQACPCDCMLTRPAGCPTAPAQCSDN